ncbi:MAG: hypothetical protein JWP15_3830, partial [Alphaproteobacteria bacterium]|nr:hypothetical protein [Alphaproteobacteria bacterium]
MLGSFGWHKGEVMRIRPLVKQTLMLVICVRQEKVMGRLEGKV